VAAAALVLLSLTPVIVPLFIGRQRYGGLTLLTIPFPIFCIIGLALWISIRDQ
jgi:hypothetical protein